MTPQKGKALLMVTQGREAGRSLCTRLNIIEVGHFRV